MVQETKAYYKLVEDLKEYMNNNDSQDQFMNALKSLKTNYHIEISKEFLKDLIEDKTSINKIKRVNRVLNSLSLSVKVIYKYTKSLNTYLYKTNVINYVRLKDGEVLEKSNITKTCARESITHNKKAYHIILI